MRHATRATLLSVLGIMTLAAVATRLAGAASPHADLPASGHSRFDELIGDAPVPFPFARLVALIEGQMQPDPGGLSPLKLTLIPLGRSLQRDAGAPAFFRFPRVVAAADGANKPGFAPLRDRLFVGYHERAGVLEVISYNDAAARFEFQVVRDYQAGRTPTVTYARRALCLACHQNAAPIFARPLWDETSANPELARRLRVARPDFYGRQPTGTDIAYFIDASTDRASLIPVWQAIWQHGCGGGEQGARCRMDAFAAALDYARDRTLPPAHALPTLAHRWPGVWPDGLAVAGADLPNRDPLAPLQAPGNDPLLPRAPEAVWRTPDTTAFVVGLAGLLDAVAVARLGDRDLRPALDALRARGDFAQRPFGASQLASLRHALGVGGPARVPAVSTKRTEPVSTPEPRHARLHAHCGACHDTTLPHPPNFLHGTAAEVEAKLDQCAPRMLVRLTLAGTRARRMSPMPPASALAARGLTAHRWTGSADFAALRSGLAARLRGRVPERLLAQPYDSLPPCLPATTYPVPAP